MTLSEPISSAARDGWPKRTSQASGSLLLPIKNEGDRHGPPPKRGRTLAAQIPHGLLAGRPMSLEAVPR